LNRRPKLRLLLGLIIKIDYVTHAKSKK